ncbi:N-formylglutamate amidohydrolase [Vibrio penaeicida]|uniref:N-formylglutamate amidohydrolase n=1 Tax=Vibrio penaeicida TaxID=104609 RepID=UPI002736586C|nr:N-formylglutamate amidohydrolase [Vibrio penaeicida]MDP2574334.1 N-formylglutamate amidohydrolase [Vibrio penaeicida]
MHWLKVKKDPSTPYIFSFPHSGVELCEEAFNNLSDLGRRSLPNMDWHLNELYDFLDEYNVNIISTSMSRYVVDLNRELKKDPFGEFKQAIVYERNTWGEEIYLTKPSTSEISKRIESFYLPYHSALDELIKSAIQRFGVAYLIDLHSFMGPMSCDICLGNVYGKSSSPEFLEKLNTSFERNGFETELNNVFTGGYITAKYCNNPNVEAIQVELRYTNYLPSEGWESKTVPDINQAIFNKAKSRLKQVFLDSNLISESQSKVEGGVR